MKSSLFSISILCSAILSFNSCTDNKIDQPCNNTGTICFTNKTDSAVTISIEEAPEQFSLLKDHIQCVPLEGKGTYTIKVTGRKFSKDTVMLIQVCDEKEFVVKK